MFCIELDIELTDTNVIKELGVFIDGNVQAHVFGPANCTNPKIKHFGVEETCTEFCGTEYSQLPNILPIDVKGEKILKKGQKVEQKRKRKEKKKTKDGKGGISWLP